MDDQHAHIREVVARAISAACGEHPEHQGGARGNAFRWQDYGQSFEVVMIELQAAESGEPGRSAVSHLANTIAQSCEDCSESTWRYDRAAGDALRAYASR